MSHSALMQRRQVLRSGVTLVFVLDMKRQELFRIRVGNRILYDNLTEDEYLDRIQTIAEDFYEGKIPNDVSITTEIL